ncbi:MAG: hypothetical protein FOGNACKC_01951 [Anaerolineae bacterium]|nr:hypothetical protein [Anaerolineae bacterium]
MPAQVNASGQDETLAASLYTGHIGRSFPQIHLTSFAYTISPEKKSLLEKVGSVFGKSLKFDLPPEHQALLDQNEGQSPDDIDLANRMHHIQADTL